MNKEMVFGLIRHALTIISVGVLANGTGSIQEVISKIVQGFMTGDFPTVAASLVTLGAILWSVWVKATEQTKNAVIKTMTLGAIK